MPEVDFVRGIRGGSVTARVGPRLELRDIPTLGAIVVGDGGRSLYVFTKDEPGMSACSGECASSWPPVIVRGGASATAGTGVTGPIGTIGRRPWRPRRQPFAIRPANPLRRPPRLTRPSVTVLGLARLDV